MDCLKSALNFGADAVFLAGKMFGMRSAPQNFDNDQLKKACDLAHAKGARIHVTCNTLPRNNEIPHLQEFMENAQACGVDAFIIADLGVFEAAKKYAPKVQRHISTQAGVTNYAAANVLYNMGASRVVLAREIPLDEIAEMRAKVPKELEIECFVHGAMCVSFSGRCLISSYMTGRDANHGDCAQPCRWKYHLYEENRQGQYFPVEETGDGTYLYNSRDLCMIEHIPELVKAGISSFKIEGRAKSAYYVAVTTNAYRHAVDDFHRPDSGNSLMQTDVQPGLNEYAKHYPGDYIRSAARCWVYSAKNRYPAAHQNDGATKEDLFAHSIFQAVWSRGPGDHFWLLAWRGKRGRLSRPRCLSRRPAGALPLGIIIKTAFVRKNLKTG